MGGGENREVPFWGDEISGTRELWWLHNFVKYTKTHWTVHLNRWILWNMNYISIFKMTLRKKGSFISSPYWIRTIMVLHFLSLPLTLLHHSVIPGLQQTVVQVITLPLGASQRESEILATHFSTWTKGCFLLVHMKTPYRLSVVLIISMG